MAAEASARDHNPTLVERLLDRQRDHWRRGERVLVETLLESHPTLVDDRERLLDLIWNEVDLRAAHGETPRLDEYQGRFPALSDDLDRRFEALGQPSETLGSKGPPSDRTATGVSALSEGAPIPPPTPLPPPAIEGYEVLGLLGKGGMGVVYQARQKAAGRVVALKMILGGFADEEARARFRTEGRAVASLQHPNVVQVFEVGEHRGAPFFSLEFCAGGGLDKKLNGTPLAAAEAARLVGTLARAVQHAHERGVVHRDLKPANVLLTADGTPKVTDFGLAKRVDEVGLTQTGAVLGSPPYMAPEQARGQSKAIGPATDVYALGAILYECLTGRPPFRAATLLDTLMQVRNDDPVPPRQLQPRTPRDLETICLKCLQKDPEKRYASAEALAEDLRRYRAGEPISARPVGRLERTWRWGRRRPKDAALVAAGLLAVVLGTVAYLWFLGDRQVKATDKAERILAETKLLWEQAKIAPVEDLSPWKDALDAAGRAKEVIDANAVDEPTRRRVEKTWTAITAAKKEAEIRAASVTRYNLGLVLAEQGKLDEAAAKYQAAIQLDPTNIAAHVSLGNALADQSKLDEALAEYRTAIQEGPENPAVHYYLGLALLPNGDLAGALTAFNRCRDLSPQTATLRTKAMEKASRVQTLLNLEGKLAAVLTGTAKASSGSEMGDLAYICLAKKQYAASARLYADGFAATPSLALNAENRYTAAEAAALAACGRGKDAEELNEPERIHWGRQAREWLETERDDWAEKARSDKPQDRRAAARELQLWRCDSDFAGVRDEAELKKLPEDEQAAWRKFWADVAALVERAEKR